MLQRIVLAIFIQVFGVFGIAFAEPMQITFATDATWPPMEFVGANHEITGFSIEYMKAAAKEAGYTPVFKAVAWDGIFAGLDTGKYDAICSSVSITEERKKVMSFSEPYFRVQQALVVPNNSSAKTLEDMKGKKVGTQISTTGTFAVKKNEAVVSKTYDEVGLAMEDLFNGRIDGVVCDDPVAVQYALTNEKYKSSMKIVAILESETEEFYGIAVKKGDQKVLDLINKGIHAVKSKGIDAELQKKWMKR